MRTILYSTSPERAASFERVLRDAGYAAEVRIILGGASEQEVEASRDCSIVFVDLELGTTKVVAFLSAIRRIERKVPTLLGLIGEPTMGDVDALMAAGANMYFPDDPAKLAVRIRLLHGALERRAEIAGLVTELEAAKERSTRVAQEHRALLERNPNGVTIYRDGRLVWCNQGFTKLAGYDDSSELVGRSILDLAPPSARSVITERLRARAEGHDLAPVEIPLLRRDGRLIETLAIGMPVVFEGEPAYIGFVTDLTEKRKLEMQLVASDRMAALGRLAASVGHEINNPLTYVMANLELAQRTLGKNPDVAPEIQQMLGDALEGTERVRRIVQDLRVFTQREQDHQAVNLRAVIESCARMTAVEIRQRAELVIAIHDDLPPVRSNEARLAQVITNLLLNAAQAMPDGAADRNTITVVARAAPPDRIEIRIEDTGPGIAPESLPHVFEPFFSTKTDHGGTGLGLSICKLLIAQQGGEIALTSELGNGTCVTLHLPAADPAIGNPVRIAAPQRAPRRVLVVDDEPRVAEALRAHLVPHEVMIVTSGREALDAIASDAPFDAIVCDLMMPDVWAAELYERIRVEHSGLEQRLVFMTGGAFTPSAAHFVETVPNVCLHKPFAIEELLDAIERVARS